MIRKKLHLPLMLSGTHSMENKTETIVADRDVLLTMGESFITVKHYHKYARTRGVNQETAVHHTSLSICFNTLEPYNF